MDNFMANVLKSKIKQLRDGYVKLKGSKKSYKVTENEATDKSGLYKAEPSEELYERLSFASGSRRNSDNSSTRAITSKKCQRNSPIQNSSRKPLINLRQNSLESSRDNLDSSTDSSLDSGISKSPPANKKLKKLQFSPNSDEIYVYEERNILEKNSFNAPNSNRSVMKPQVCKTRVFNVASPQKVKFVGKTINETPEKQSSGKSEKPHLAIPYNRLRKKDSIISPKIYKQTKKNSNGESAFRQRKISNGCGNNNPFIHVTKTPPEKPPRSANSLKRMMESSITNVTQTEQKVKTIELKIESTDVKDALIDEDGYSIPVDLTGQDGYSIPIGLRGQDLRCTYSTPIKDVPKMTMEPIYAQVTPRSSRDVDSLLASVTPKTKTPHIHAQVTPRNSQNIEQYFQSVEINSSESPKATLSESPKKLNNYLSNSHVDTSTFAPDASSTIRNDILSKEVKESLNLIHQTKWSLKMDDLAQEHKCNQEKHTPEKVNMEEKFVVNMFNSRPSKRWEKHVRNINRYNGLQDDEFARNVPERMSLDSKKEKTKKLEANICIFNDNLGDVDKEIGILEEESKNLDIVTKKIKRELYRMELEANEAYSKRLQNKKNRIDQLNNNVDETSVKLANESKRIETELQQIQLQRTQEFNKYKGLKKARDVECARMTQASKALEEIKNKKGNKDWLELLVAERVLLETGERVKVLTQQIRDDTYTLIPEPPLHKGTINLTNVKFPFSKPFRGSHCREKHYTDFFVMTVSYGSQFYISEFITGETDPLAFSRNYSFKDATPDFEINIKLFCLRLRTSEEYFWEKFSCNFCPTSQIIYEDLLTHQLQEKTVYRTSFKLCAETTLTRNHIDEFSARLNTKPDIFGKLDSQMEFNLKCENIDIIANLSGFLDVGTLHGDVYFWEKKWCVLNGPNLLLYNYPQEADFGKPFEQINLEYCFGPIITKVENCPKRRTFHLKTGRPNDIVTNSKGEDIKVRTLKTKPNFALRKFYFSAGNMEEYVRWTVEVEKILNSLNDFKKLAFGEEYVEYLKH